MCFCCLQWLNVFLILDSPFQRKLPPSPSLLSSSLREDLRQSGNVGRGLHHSCETSRNCFVPLDTRGSCTRSNGVIFYTELAEDAGANCNSLASQPHLFFSRLEIIAFLLPTNLITKCPDCLGYRFICKPET